MAKKKNNYNNLIIIGILLALVLLTYMTLSQKKEYFTNVKENFESLKEKNSCGTCSLNK